MDFSKIDLGPISERAETTVVTGLMINEAVVQNGNGDPLEIEALAPGTPAAKRACEISKRRYGIGKPDQNDYAELTDDEIEQVLNTEDEGAADMAARLICRWNLQYEGGEPVDCTYENRRAFFMQMQDVGTALSLKYAELAIEMGKSKAASTSGRRKKATSAGLPTSKQ